jgi:hypothetical protein
MLGSLFSVEAAAAATGSMRMATMAAAAMVAAAMGAATRHPPLNPQ